MPAVPGHLGDHRGGRDRGAGAVSLDQPAMRHVATLERETVHKGDRLRSRAKSPDRLGQTFDVAHVEAVGVDVAGRSHHDHNPDRAGKHLRIEPLPGFRGQLLGVADSRKPAPTLTFKAVPVQQHGRGNDRSGETAATRLVSARDHPRIETEVMPEEFARSGLRGRAIGGARAHRSGSAASKWQRPFRSAIPRAAGPRSGCRHCGHGCRPS